MDKDYWWWAVYDMQKNEVTIDISDQYDISLLVEKWQGLRPKVLLKHIWASYHKSR